MFQVFFKVKQVFISNILKGHFEKVFKFWRLEFRVPDGWPSRSAFAGVTVGIRARLWLRVVCLYDLGG